MVRPASPPGSSQVLSFRHLLTEAVQGFLKEEGLGDSGLADALSELIITLSRYREEGEPLFPMVFLGDDLGAMLSMLGGQEPLAIGTGLRTRETIERALKQCAPLGQGRWWALYLLLVPEGLAYGIFRSDPFPLLETPFERMSRGRDRSVHVVGLLQLAESVIELRGTGGLHRHIYLSGARVDAVPPTAVLDSLAQAATMDVAEPLRVMAGDFYRRVLFEVMQASHGALVAVLPQARGSSPLFVDGILLPEPLDLTAPIARYQEGAEGAVSAVSSLAQLLRGMMATDGITVLRSDGRILGYNVFIRHPETLARAALLVGGARRRTFDVLCASVGTELVAAFFRSQDGAIACRRA
ncbi:hypothetical protein POL68_27225 [Stigmatella sp. ncwal1]|uniref:DAC domain-containing protein n=1 Tax=Stigmatella ashevillensis TaxID=2995309 RepID=A0ABT5DF45_9BACT|nr:hypothetical protein [Stigmatella ashevillena]MDC0712189.1 hypothetical protein [Stigmatella ashevillena]